MRFTTLIPNIFYADIQVGLQLFVSCLGFTLVYDDLDSEHPFCVAARDGLKVHLVQSPEFAAKDRPELRLETDDIEAAYAAVLERFPQLLHRNLSVIKKQPWGAQEFALADSSGVCIIIQQW
ncbi:MAG TPA: hypothetical protein VGC22_08235 [Chitinophaga sp.]